MAELTSIEIRVKKLLKHSQSAKEIGSLEEAELFATKAQELLLEHNLDMAKILLSEDSDKFKNWMYGEKISFKCNQAGARWRLALAGVLCDHNFTSYTYNSHSKTLRVYGKMENVDTVVWLYNYLSTGLMSLAQKAHTSRNVMDSLYYTNRYAYLKDWLLGAVAGLGKKMTKVEEESERKSEVTALMIYVKDALNEFKAKEIPNLKKGRKSKTVYVGPAYTKGMKVGENYSINKPLQNNVVEQKLI